VRGVLAPVLNHYAVGFNPVHGFNSATQVYNTAQDDSDQELIVLYVGDFDPSGMFMSEADLPKRLFEYGGGDHITIRRIALTPEQVTGLPSFPATDKRKDPRYKWFVANDGRDFLVIRADCKPLLVVARLELAADVVMAAERATKGGAP
jgi:hypothetical protein